MSPGVPLDAPIAQAARARGIEVLGDVELFARAVRAPVIGVTGTNGKSTVTSLVAHMADAAGRRVLAGGNLGVPALDLLEEPTADLYVLELSSFQLETTWSLNLEAAVVLNVSADHLDRYATVAAYASAKARIFEHAATVVLNADDPLVAAMRGAEGTRVVTFSIESATADYCLLHSGGKTQLARRGAPLLDIGRMKLTGLHNAANALAALALGDAVGLPMDAMLAALESFPGLPHRSAWVADVAGVRYIDDSKGTNVGATLAAVAGMQGPLVMIAGGLGKGQDFAPLAAGFRGKVRHTVLIGKDAPALAAALAGVGTVETAASMQAAVRAASRAAKPGDTVLLSPACASLDMFRDYAERGDVFAAAVRALAEPPS
jgi:UDP-N-acetylmuramoylalanine--D-glutamate ligase